MPKLRMNDQQLREEALKVAMAKGRVRLGLEKDGDLGDYLGIPRATLSRKKQDPYQGFGFAEAAKLARELRFSAEDLCAIFGVPMRKESGDGAA